MLNSSLCRYSYEYIVIKGTMPVPNAAGADNTTNNIGKKVIIKNCAPLTDCINKINNTQVNNDVVMSMYNITEDSNNYTKTSGTLWQYCRDGPDVNTVYDDIVKFHVANAINNSIKYKRKITCKTGNSGTNYAKIMELLKYFSNFWRTLEISLTNSEINVILNWSKNCINLSTDVDNQKALFLITNTKIYVSLLTLSIQDYVKLLQQLKSGFKRTIKCNKYQSKTATEKE